MPNKSENDCSCGLRRKGKKKENLKEHAATMFDTQLLSQQKKKEKKSSNMLMQYYC